MQNNIKIDSVNNYKIPCVEYIPEKVEQIVIAIHGFGGDKTSHVIKMLAESLYNKKIGTIAFDLPGHGQSEVNGEFFTVNNCLNDLFAIENYIKKKYLTPISIFATSYGGYLTFLRILDFENSFENIVVRCPAINMYDIFKKNILKNTKSNKDCNGKYYLLGYERKIKIYNKYIEEIEKNKIFEKINSLKNHITIIHGTEDDMAPITDSRKIKEKKPNLVKLIEIPGANHRFENDGEKELLIEYATIEFLTKKEQNDIMKV